MSHTHTHTDIKAQTHTNRLPLTHRDNSDKQAKPPIVSAPSTADTGTNADTDIDTGTHTYWLISW